MSPRSGRGPSASSGLRSRGGNLGVSAHDSEGAVGAVLGELRLFLGVAAAGGWLLVACGPHRNGHFSGSALKAGWLIGLALFGVGNGPALGLLYDYANRTTVASEMVGTVTEHGNASGNT